MATVTGTLSELWRYPVKSMRGERVDALRVDDRGAAGDRTHAVWHEHKGRPQQLTAREAPRLLAWAASYGLPGDKLDPADPPEPHLRAPDGTHHDWPLASAVALGRHAGTAAALSEDLGRQITLRRDVAGQQDLERSLLFTTVQSHEALQRELGRPIDDRRWRTNLVLDLPDVDPWLELTWEGGTVDVDDVAIDVLYPCVRCAIPTRDPDTQVKDVAMLKHLVRHHDTLFGMNARVTTPGTLREGARVTIRTP